jgi:hypothetical protein
MRTHRGIAHRDWLRSQLEDLFIRENLSRAEVARRLDIDRHTVGNWLREFDLDGKDAAKFHLEEKGMSGPFAGYPRWTHTGTGHRVRVHRLQMIAAGADPHKVFDGNYSVDHINGCPLDNREENLRLMENADHGAKDGERSDTGHSHAEYLRALVQQPPEWAQNLDLGEEY